MTLLLQGLLLSTLSMSVTIANNDPITPDGKTLADAAAPARAAQPTTLSNLDSVARVLDFSDTDEDEDKDIKNN